MLTKFPFTALHEWYQTNGRHDLPWRDYNYDKKQLGYRVWLSETMLQQTQVERVREYFENILEAFPTVEDLAACSYEDFFPYYKGLGYYSRARNMLKAAKMVVDTFDGRFPQDIKSLQKLPGVGPYTADAICAFAYDLPTLSFDTNLEKIFSRYYYGNKYQILSKEEKTQIVHDFSLTNILPRDINNALMDYGAIISLNATININWEKYPLESSKFYQTRGSLEPVIQKKKSSFPNKKAYVIAILHKDHKEYFSAPPHPTSPYQGEEQTIVSSLLNKERIEGGFSPFFIGKNTGNPRSQIQNYFVTKYNLEVSVRPPEIKSYNKNEIPYMISYCQIQSGTNLFHKCDNIKVRGFEEGYVDRLDFGEDLSLF